MTTVKNTFESGLASGTDVTTSNTTGYSGATAFTNVVPGTGGTIKFSNAHVMKGSLALEFTPASGQACYVEWLNVAGATNAGSYRGYFYLTGYPSSGQAIINIRSAGGGTSLAQVVVGVDGTLSAISDVAAATVWTSTGQAALNTWYRIEPQITNGTSTTGAFTLDVFPGDGAKVTNLSGAVTAQNFGTSTIGTARAGRVSAAGTMAKLYLDDAALQTASATPIGASAANVPPTSSAGSDVTNGVVSTPVTVTGTDSDSDGTVTTRQWTLVSYPAGSTAPTLSNATTAAVTFTPAATGIYVLQYQVTDDGGATSTPSTMKVFVPGTVVRPYAITSNAGGWTLVGSDIVTALTDASAASYTKSSTTTANPSTTRIRLDPLKAPGNFSLAPKWLLSAAGAGTAKVRLYEGSTLRKEWVAAGGQVPTTTEAAQTFALTSGEIATVTSWLAIDVEIEWGV